MEMRSSGQMQERLRAQPECQALWYNLPGNGAGCRHRRHGNRLEPYILLQVQ